jgi:hypothetical protein
MTLQYYRIGNTIARRNRSTYLGGLGGLGANQLRWRDPVAVASTFWIAERGDERLAQMHWRDPVAFASTFRFAKRERHGGVLLAVASFLLLLRSAQE